MSPSGIALALLDSRFHLTSNDDLMLAFVRDLWAPFEVDGAGAGAVEVSIERSADRWRMELPGEAGGAVDPWIFAAVLRNSLSRCAIAAAASVVPLHGAAVERGGVYVVLSAPPEAGKTTLLLELLERGWRLVTDDLIPLDPTELSATPFLKPLSVRDPDRWRRFATRWEVPGWLPSPEAVGLIPATAFPCVDRRPFRAHLVVFPAFSEGAGPEGAALTPAQTVASAAANLHPAGRATPARIAALGRWGRATAGYRIRYGSSAAALKLLEGAL